MKIVRPCGATGGGLDLTLLPGPRPAMAALSPEQGEPSIAAFYSTKAVEPSIVSFYAANAGFGASFSASHWGDSPLPR